MKKIYLSSFEHLLDNGQEIFKHYQEITSKYGYQLLQMPEEHFQLKSSLEENKRLANKKLELLKQADIVIANTDNFRSKGEPYGETSLEIGIAYKLKKDIYYYMSDTRVYGERYDGTVHQNEKGEPVDENNITFDPGILNIMLLYSANKIIKGSYQDVLEYLKEGGN